MQLDRTFWLSNAENRFVIAKEIHKTLFKKFFLEWLAKIFPMIKKILIEYRQLF